MAKDYMKVEPDRVALLGRHFTSGRGGRKIRYITRHHTAGVLNADQINNVWRTRPASATYLIDPNGIVSQHVWDKDTPWSNANSVSNQESITIEHSNSAGPAQDWPIAAATIDEGARWAAALCRFYKLGRPHFGTNIRDHRQFSATSCPYHLANGGKYHNRYMSVAQAFYDELTNPQEGFLMALSDAEQRELLDKTRRIHHELTYGFRSRYTDPDTGEQSAFEDTLVGYVLEADKKLENMDAVQLPAIRDAIDKDD